MHKYQNFFESYLSCLFIDDLQENIIWVNLNLIDQIEHLSKEIEHQLFE